MAGDIYGGRYEGVEGGRVNYAEPFGEMDFSDLYIDPRDNTQIIGTGKENISNILQHGSPMQAMLQRFLRSPEMLNLFPNENLRESIITGDFTFEDILEDIPKEYLNLPDSDFPKIDHDTRYADEASDTQLLTTLGLVQDYDKAQGFINWATDKGLDPKIAGQWQNVFSELHRGYTETYLADRGFDVSNPGMEGMIFDEQTGITMDWQERALRDRPEDVMNILGYNLFEDQQIMNEMKTLDEVDLNEFPEE